MLVPGGWRSRGIVSNNLEQFKGRGACLDYIFGTKLSWLSNYILFMLKMNKAMILKHGLFSVKAEKILGRGLTISGDLTPTVFFFSFLQIRAVMVNFRLSVCIY
ncbi:MAG: hypothetical protein CM15mP62_31730 [Rhodospirillaceae bacterium]|nr:MAG: hypothetical protein CM15mP62_31730 [Rhodospirillaceae bacterium]